MRKEALTLSRTGQRIRCSALCAGLVFAGLVLPDASMAGAQGNVAAASCRTSQVRETVKTDTKSYPKGATVKMTVAIRNESARACSVAIGPTSPSLSILNSKGVVVCNNCYSNGQPGACALYLMLHKLAAKGLYTITRTWNQRSGPTSDFVARGKYTLTSRFSSVGSGSKFGFTLTG